MHPLSNLSSILIANPGFISAVKFIVYLGLFCILFALFCKLFCGKGSAMNHALSSALGILFIYIATVALYTFNPYGLSKFLAPLPFVTFEDEYIIIFSFQNAQMTEVCRQILSMIILAFLVNLFDGILPTGNRLILWYTWRTVTALLSMTLHYGICWVFNTFFPGVLVTYAPTVLLWILLGFFFIGLLNIILSLLLAVISPIFGLIYGFFFSNTFGKQLSKALLSTLILCIVIIALNHFGFAYLSISVSALQAYIPVILGLLIIWYFIGHI